MKSLERLRTALPATLRGSLAARDPRGGRQLPRWVAPVAALLPATMVVAIGTAGIGHGDVIPSLTLAPAPLIAMLYLLARGLGRPASLTSVSPGGDG